MEYYSAMKMIQMNFDAKQKQRHRLREQMHGYQGERRDGLGDGDIYTITYIHKTDN